MKCPMANLHRLGIYMGLILLASLVTTACNNKASTIKDELARMLTQPIRLPLDKMVCRYRANETIVIDSVPHPLRLVVYVDSSKCSPCTLDNMYTWNTLVEETDSLYGKRLGYVFIVAPKPEQREDTYLSIESSGLKCPMYVDTTYAFRLANPQLPADELYHTFLLDSGNNALLIGDPLNNARIRNILDEILMSNLNK